MSLTVAQIAARAANAVQGAITDAVHVATLAQITRGADDPDTGQHAITTTTTTGRAVFQGSSPARDPFPGYTIGPNDQIIMLFEMTAVKKNDRVTIGARTYTIQAVQDVAGAGTVFMVAAQ